MPCTWKPQALLVANFVSLSPATAQCSGCPRSYCWEEDDESPDRCCSQSLACQYYRNANPRGPPKELEVELNADVAMTTYKIVSSVSSQWGTGFAIAVTVGMVLSVVILCVMKTFRHKPSHQVFLFFKLKTLRSKLSVLFLFFSLTAGMVAAGIPIGYLISGAVRSLNGSFASSIVFQMLIGYFQQLPQLAEHQKEGLEFILSLTSELTYPIIVSSYTSMLSIAGAPALNCALDSSKGAFTLLPDTEKSEMHLVATTFGVSSLFAGVRAIVSSNFGQLLVLSLGFTVKGETASGGPFQLAAKFALPLDMSKMPPLLEYKENPPSITQVYNALLSGMKAFHAGDEILLDYNALEITCPVISQIIALLYLSIFFAGLFSSLLTCVVCSLCCMKHEVKFRNPEKWQERYDRQLEKIKRRQEKQKHRTKLDVVQKTVGDKLVCDPVSFPMPVCAPSTPSVQPTPSPQVSWQQGSICRPLSGPGRNHYSPKPFPHLQPYHTYSSAPWQPEYEPSSGPQRQPTNCGFAPGINDPTKPQYLIGHE